jgi:hypothetical protein
VALKGKSQLNARLRAIKRTFKPIGKAWALDDVAENRRRVPVKTGRLQRSFRVRNASQTRATVVGHFTANFVDAGTKAHTESAHRQAMSFAYQGRTIFAGRRRWRPSGRTRWRSS